MFVSLIDSPAKLCSKSVAFLLLTVGIDVVCVDDVSFNILLILCLPLINFLLKFVSQALIILLLFNFNLIFGKFLVFWMVTASSGGGEFFNFMLLGLSRRFDVRGGFSGGCN